MGSKEGQQVNPRRSKDWSQNELKQLQAAVRKKASAKEIAKSLGRPIASVRRMARSLHLLLYKKRPKADSPSP
jgi:hypothetical protein